ncbi:hypothetical protein [Actinacidiphila oryziradicis]|uniref:DUF8094 domain-containing protein n=1 Tax=Actinacidiphila oryziradicis TaxID=2571141 RepID=A0A4V6WIX0_9ACTN|nr:hypothetical protein [Actinacidiphila oryziradicis]TJZ97068.1 hypothetical protein FCI23_50040 [Actinacidiphila oryziradicis]
MPQQTMGSGTAQAGARDRVSLVAARAAITLDDAPPKIALDADGYATALPADAKGLAVPNSIAAAHCRRPRTTAPRRRTHPPSRQDRHGDDP